jgi:hypothetical protein
LAKRWDSIYEITKIKKIESKERSKIVNFANIILCISDKPADLNLQTFKKQKIKRDIKGNITKKS